MYNTKSVESRNSTSSGF